MDCHGNFSHGDLSMRQISETIVSKPDGIKPNELVGKPKRVSVWAAFALRGNADVSWV